MTEAQAFTGFSRESDFRNWISPQNNARSLDMVDRKISSGLPIENIVELQISNVPNSNLSSNETSRKTSTTAGDENRSQPSAHQKKILESFETLRSAISEIEIRKSMPAAAGVSARMRQIDPQFSPAALGFSSFREFLRNAAEEGQIVLDTTSKDDLVVKSASASHAPPSDARLRIRRDIWRAYLDTSDDRFIYSTSDDRLRKLDGRITVGTDISFADDRSSKRQQWMRTFVENEPPAHKTLLDTALSGPSPEDSFMAVVSESTSLARRWGKALREQLTAEVVRWARDNSIPLDQIATPETRRPVEQPGQSPKKTIAAPQASSKEDALRSRIFDILASMPLSELLKLPIPIEYSLRQ